MIGAIIGDIAGSRFEFNNTHDYNFEIFHKDCSYTDDTICTVAVADAILRGIDYKDSILYWCRKYPHPMGAYGGSFSRWLASPDPQPYDSFGNGAAMRVSPVGWAFSKESDVIRNAISTAIISHNHPEGIIGAVAVARAIYMFRFADAFSDIAVLQQVLEMVATYYGSDWEAHLPAPGIFNETCQGCVPLAFHIIKHSTSFEEAIRRAIYHGGDSDTLGAIVGSIAEARWGLDIKTIQATLNYLPNEMQEVVMNFVNSDEKR